jgi:hypothetical protein
MEKKFNQKSFHYFFWTPLGNIVNIKMRFFLQFATGVNGTGGKFASGVFETGGNLPPALLTHQQHQRNWWKNFPPVSLILVASLPPVLLILAVHLDLRISPQIFEKF